MEIAPDFELTDTQGEQVRLSQFRGKRFIVLTFLRGFA
jgi:peroxiredoxin